MRRGDLAVALPAAIRGQIRPEVFAKVLVGDLAYDPYDVLLWWNLGVTYGRMGQAEQMRQALFNARQLAPHNETIRNLYVRIP